MSSKRYPPEFKDEAVRQVLKRGHKVADVAERLGVASHSLYQWVKAVQPNDAERHHVGPRFFSRTYKSLEQCVVVMVCCTQRLNVRRPRPVSVRKVFAAPRKAGAA